MKNHKLFNLLLVSLILLMSCGKPTDPETIKPIEPADKSGGYKVVARMTAQGYAQDVLKKDNLLYMAQGEGGLLIVDVSDPKTPQTVSVTTENVRGYSVKIAIKDSVAFIAAGDFGVTVVNVANPAAPVVTVSNSDMKPARNIHIMGDYLFTAISERGVKISEISVPTEPDIRGGITTNGYAYGVTSTADQNKLLVACGEMGLSVYDISDFQNGFGVYPRITWCDTPGYAEAVAISENNESIAFLACGNFGLQIVDYSDNDNPRIVGVYDTIGYAKSLKYFDNKIYMATQVAGVQVINVSDVTKPTLVGIIKTEYAMGIDKDDKYLYVADRAEGLIVISIPQ